MNEFQYERMDVYRVAKEYSAIAEVIANNLPRGRGYLVDQLRRASGSIRLNIAEGVGEYSPRDKARFYRIARRSATECAAILENADEMNLADAQLVSQCRALLLRVVAMLTAMILRLKDRDSDSI